MEVLFLLGKDVKMYRGAKKGRGMSSRLWFIVLFLLLVFVFVYNINKDFIGDNRFLINKHKWDQTLPMRR